MIQVRCLCDADLYEHAQRAKVEGMTCWNCGRAWNVPRGNVADVRLRSGPTKTPAPIEGGTIE